MFNCKCSDCRHEGPVWQLAWAHPMYGSILASCGYDKKVIIWKETNGTWNKLYEHSNHESSGSDLCNKVMNLEVSIKNPYRVQLSHCLVDFCFTATIHFVLE